MQGGHGGGGACGFGGLPLPGRQPDVTVGVAGGVHDPLGRVEAGEPVIAAHGVADAADAALGQSIDGGEDPVLAGAVVRARMTGELEAELDAGGHAWRRLTGPLQRRVQDGLDAIDALRP